MDRKNILEKAIQKAIDGGWKMPFGSNGHKIQKYVESRPESIVFGYKEDWQDEYHLEGHWSIPELIFNHDFAKALWNEEYKKWPLYKIKNYEFHLQQMVIAEDPIKYLGENI